MTALSRQRPQSGHYSATLSTKPAPASHQQAEQGHTKGNPTPPSTPTSHLIRGLCASSIGFWSLAACPSSRTYRWITVLCVRVAEHTHTHTHTHKHTHTHSLSLLTAWWCRGFADGGERRTGAAGRHRRQRAGDVRGAQSTESHRGRAAASPGRLPARPALRPDVRLAACVLARPLSIQGAGQARGATAEVCMKTLGTAMGMDSPCAPFCANRTRQADVRRAFSQHGEMGGRRGCRGVDM